MSSQDFEPFILSPLDHVWPPVLYIGSALYFRAEQGFSTENVAEDLERGIERLLHIVPFLRGVVAPVHVEGKSNVLGLQAHSSSSSSSRASLPFVQVKHYPQYGLPVPGDNILNNGKPDAKEGSGDECTGKQATPRLITCADRLTEPTGEPSPVFRAQINVLADGVALVLMASHGVFDGKGYDVLLGLLARCCRDPIGADWPAVSAAAQVDERHYLASLVSKNTKNTMKQVSTVGGNYARGEGLVPGESSAQYNFRFSAARIQELKVECNARLPALLQRLRSENNTSREKLPEFISSTDVLTAVLWISAAPAMASEQQTSVLGCAVESRKKFPRALANEYMGNSAVIGETKLGLSELHDCKMDGGNEVDDSTLELLTRIAYRIRCCIADWDGPSLSQLTADYSQKDDWSQLLATRSDFYVTSLREWALFGQDFGPRMGRVRSMEWLPFSTTTGECVVKPATRRLYSEDGRGESSDKSVAWEVMVTLPPDQVNQMCQTSVIRWLLESVSQAKFYRRL